MLRFLVVSILTAVVLSSACHACQCMATERPCEYLGLSDTQVIFVGRVIEISPQFAMRFAVEESLLGTLGREVTVWTDSGGGDCGLPLPPGQRAIVFASEHDGKLWTGSCSGTRRLSDGPSDDKIIEQYREMAAGVERGKGTIFGRVMQPKLVWHRSELVEDWSSVKPLEGITVHAKSENFSAAARTKENGSYEFVGLPIGKYTVVADAAGGLQFDREYAGPPEEDLTSGSCRLFNFKVHTQDPRPFEDQLEQARKDFAEQEARLQEFKNEHQNELPAYLQALKDHDRVRKQQLADIGREWFHILAEFTRARAHYQLLGGATKDDQPAAPDPQN